MRRLYITSALWRRSHARSDPTCMTLAWPNGAGCAEFPVVDAGFVDAVDAEVPPVPTGPRGRGLDPQRASLINARYGVSDPRPSRNMAAQPTAYPGL